MMEEESQLSLEPHLPFLWNSDVRDLKISISLAWSAGAQSEDALGLHSRLWGSSQKGAPKTSAGAESLSAAHMMPSRTFHAFLHALGGMNTLCLSLHVRDSQLALRNSGLDPKTLPIFTWPSSSLGGLSPDTKQARPTLGATPPLPLSSAKAASEKINKSR